MKKAFTIVAALLCMTAAAWADGTELFDPSTASIKSYYIGPNWTVDATSTATYDAATGTISVDIKSALSGQWQGQVKLNHNVTFDETKAYTVSLKFHSNKALGGVTLKMDDNAQVVFANQSIQLPADADYVYTSEQGNGVAGNNKILVFDFGYAAAGTQITISDISIKEVGDAVVPDPVTHPAPATAPTRDAADVFSIYSDAYTAGTAMAIGGWGQTTAITEVNLSATDKAYYCTTSNYMGWELNSNQAVTALANYPMAHIDVYVAEAGSIQFTPIWKNGENNAEALHTYTLAAGWNALEIDLAADFAGINLAGIFQLKWAAMPATCYIDNVYFYKKSGATAIENASAVVRAEKVLRNGQVMILRNGTLYTAQGQMVEE